MTDQQQRLEAIEARLKAATPGPWRLWECIAGCFEVCKSFDYATGGVCQPHRYNDALFIAAAPADIAFLLELAKQNSPPSGPSKSKDPMSPDIGGGQNSSVAGAVLAVSRQLEEMLIPAPDEPTIDWLKAYYAESQHRIRVALQPST